MAEKYFKTASHFREWLQEHHDTSDELWVIYYKKGTGLESITYPQSIDEALCFGWIDGLRQSIDEQRYRIRFTPRRPDSNWSQLNLRRVKELKKLGKMAPAGIKIFEQRKQSGDKYSYEAPPQKLPKEFEDELRSNTAAWEFFLSLSPSAKKLSIKWVMSAKREETRRRRLTVLIDSSSEGRKIPPLIISRKKG
ncbi:MAG: YdeI/OmpD-associated family protein [Calditrichia bacterium]